MQLFPDIDQLKTQLVIITLHFILHLDPFSTQMNKEHVMPEIGQTDKHEIDSKEIDCQDINVLYS